MIEKSILAIVLFERKKARHTMKKKLDTDFKNSLGCAVAAYEKTVESKTL